MTTRNVTFNNDDPSNDDDESCAVCKKNGLLTECDDCHIWTHWWCTDPDHQPTSGSFYCSDCRKANDKHPTPWDELAPSVPWHVCGICFDRKPAPEFSQLLPTCECKLKVCALCAYHIAEKAGPENAGSRCPTCRMQWIAIRPRTTNGVPGDPIPLDHKHGREGGDDGEWSEEEELAAPLAPPQPAAVRTYQPLRELGDTHLDELAPRDTHLDELAPLAPLAPRAPPASPAPPQPAAARTYQSRLYLDDAYLRDDYLDKIADDDDDSDDSDDDDYVDGSTVADTPPRSKRKRRNNIATGEKKKRAPVGGQIRANFPSVKTPGVMVSRWEGSEPRTVAYTDERMNLVGNLVTKLEQKNENDPEAVALHMQVLMIKNCEGTSSGGAGNLNKHPQRIKEFMRNGIESRNQFNIDDVELKSKGEATACLLAKAAVETARENARKKSEANCRPYKEPSTKERKHMTNYWSAFVKYAELLKLEAAGTLVASV